MSRRELDAAGIVDPALRASYERCRELNAAHGKTYYLATLLLPPAKRPYVHALYGFARYADEIVDDLGRDARPTAEGRASSRPGASTSSPTCDRGGTATTRSAGPSSTPSAGGTSRCEHFEAFLHSMAMDLTVTEYADLRRPVRVRLRLGRGDRPADGARSSSRRPTRRTTARQDLGVAFQLANFVRDVGEDLDRGRVYLPLEDLDRFGAHPRRRSSGASSTTGSGDAAAQFQIARVRALEEASRARASRCCTRRSRPCIEAARVLYCGIVDEVERHRLRGVRPAGRRCRCHAASRSPSRPGCAPSAPAARAHRRGPAATTAAARTYGSRWTPRRPHHTHHASVSTTRAKPNSRSSTGANAMRPSPRKAGTSHVPTIASPSYRTIREAR